MAYPSVYNTAGGELQKFAGLLMDMYRYNNERKDKAEAAKKANQTEAWKEEMARSQNNRVWEEFNYRVNKDKEERDAEYAKQQKMEENWNKYLKAIDSTDSEEVQFDKRTENFLNLAGKYGVLNDPRWKEQIEKALAIEAKEITSKKNDADIKKINAEIEDIPKKTKISQQNADAATKNANTREYQAINWKDIQWERLKKDDRDYYLRIYNSNRNSNSPPPGATIEILQKLKRSIEKDISNVAPNENELPTELGAQSFAKYESLKSNLAKVNAWITMLKSQGKTSENALKYTEQPFNSNDPNSVIGQTSIYGFEENK